MKEKAFGYLYLLSFVVLMAACGSTPSYDECGDVEYVKTFPNEYSLAEHKPALSDFEGVVSIKGVDALLMGINSNQEYYMGLYSLETGHKILDLFKQGQGPGEYAMSPTIQRFFTHNDSLYACMKYNPDKEVFLLNITSSIQEGKEIIENRSFPKDFKSVKDIIPLASGDSLMIYRDYGEGGFKRYILHAEGNRQAVNIGNVIPKIEEIDHNILSFLVLPFKNDSLVAEANITLNQIKVYSLYDQSIGKTICVGSELDDINSMSSRWRGNIPRSYGGVQLWGDKLIFLYHGLKEKDYRDNIGHSELQIFDSDMKPCSRIKLPVIASAMYVDKNGVLYAFNPLGDNEYIYKYDIKLMLQ